MSPCDTPQQEKPLRHARASGNPVFRQRTPAFAWVTRREFSKQNDLAQAFTCSLLEPDHALNPTGERLPRSRMLPAWKCV